MFYFKCLNRGLHNKYDTIIETGLAVVKITRPISDIPTVYILLFFLLTMTSHITIKKVKT